MARITYVKAAKQRYEQVPVLNPDGTPKIVPVMRGNAQKVTKNGKPVTMRVTVDDKSRPKPLLRCESCGKDIEIGTPYKHVTPKSGPYGGYQRNRHADCPTWRPSELSSSKMAAIMAAQESFEDQIASAEDWDTIKQLLDEVAEAAREVASEYGESADNMEDGFGHETSASAELREKSDALEGWADELEQAIDSEDTEPTVDHNVYTVHDMGGNQVIETEFETDEDAERALLEYADENNVDTDTLTVEENAADEPNEEETENWLEQLREVASNAVNEVPV